MLTDIYKPEILELIGARNWIALREALSEFPPPEVAELLMQLRKPDRTLLFRTLPLPLATEAFVHLGPEQASVLVQDLTDEESRHLLAGLTPDDRTHLLTELPGRVVQRVLNLLSPEDLAEAGWLLGYPEGSAGRLMTPDYVALHPEWTIADALQHLRRFGKDSETINRVYVVDADWRLLDDLELRRIILASPGARVSEIMDHSFAFVSAFAGREEAAEIIGRYDLVALPVLGSDGVLVGIVTVDDLLDVVVQEATEDFHRVGSVEPIRGSVRDASIRVLYRSRVGWLMGLVFVNILSGAVIASYEELIAQIVVLVVFLPLLIASAGNAGSQASTLMVRALATGDVEPSDWLRLLSREVAVAGVLGATMAIAVSVLGLARGGPEVALVVGITMVLVVVVGSLVGMSLPFLLDRLKLDPATASAPLVTSIADIVGVLVYLAIASWILLGHV